ncbi:hypothetical protein [Pelistega ratti]|uniref:hypothetical protein n=1 Tax=Pelistega ratti TaxID=2652177 RepID=UPI00135BE27A|nr:hypothetical protein [Pelistega ratti]
MLVDFFSVIFSFKYLKFIVIAAVIPAMLTSFITKKIMFWLYGDEGDFQLRDSISGVVVIIILFFVQLLNEKFHLF